jgi:hypothetical protein
MKKTRGQKSRATVPLKTMRSATSFAAYVLAHIRTAMDRKKHSPEQDIFLIHFVRNKLIFQLSLAEDNSKICPSKVLEVIIATPRP